MLTNRRRVALALVTACATFGLYIGGAAAQAVTVTITVDENCRGTLVSSVGQSGPVPCSRIQDPGPGGLAGAMTYALPGGPTLNLTDGDLFLIEPGESGLSEFIRFNGTGAGATLVFYSDSTPGDPAPAQADIGFPALFQTNTLTRIELGAEGNNGFVYTPNSGQPGFVTVTGGPAIIATYVIKSDVPEPGTLLLLGLGLAGLGFGVWRRNRVAA